MASHPCNEAREGWTYLVVPLSGSEHWERTGAELEDVFEIRFGFDSWDAPPPLIIRSDGISFRH